MPLSPSPKWVFRKVRHVSGKPLENQKHRLCFAGISQAADQVQEGADGLAQDAQEVVDDLEETFESAADAAAQQLATTADQFQSAAQGAADSASNFVDSLQSRHCSIRAL